MTETTTTTPCGEPWPWWSYYPQFIYQKQYYDFVYPNTTIYTFEKTCHGCEGKGWVWRE